MALELVKENIDCEQIVTESSTDTMIKGEYLVPDTHPDVMKILMFESKPRITTKEVMQDKIMVDGIIDINVIYVSKDEKGEICNLLYTAKFSDYIDVKGADHSMACDADCIIEHMECNIVNDRKIAVNGVVTIKASVNKVNSVSIVKDVTGVPNVQYLRNPSTIDRIKTGIIVDMVAKSSIKVPQDKPPIGKVLRCDVNVHKKDVKVLDGKINYSACAKIDILYLGPDSGEMSSISDDVLFNKEIDVPEASEAMDSISDFVIDAQEYDIKEDDLGENRIVDTEVLVKGTTKLMYKENVELIDDVYSPGLMMDTKKNKFDLNVLQGHVNTETLVRCNMETDNVKAKDVLCCSTNVILTDKKVMEDKVLIEGILNVRSLYTTDDGVKIAEDEVPFNSSVDVKGCNIDMKCNAVASIDSAEACVESNTIGVKAMINLSVMVNYATSREFLVDVIPKENEVPKKNASVTIYVVQNGDSLWKIAKRYSTTVDNLLGVNEIEDQNVISPGQKIIIPGRAYM